MTNSYSDRESRRLFLKQMATSAAVAALSRRIASGASASEAIIDDLPLAPPSVVPFSPDAGLEPVDAPSTQSDSLATADDSEPLIANPNILIIMVDQFRQPMWLTALTASQYNTYLSTVILNIAGLMSQSYVFPQFYCCATPCTPSRSAFLTGLYSQQQYMLVNAEDDSFALNPAFHTYGKILPAINPSYADRMWWFGKWHLSDARGPIGNPLLPYGFQTNLVPNNEVASPNGWANEGVSGGVFQGNLGDTLNGHPFDSDQQIVDDFVNNWVPLHGSDGPWCVTVSLVNPHDISWFPDWYFPDTYPTRANASSTDAHYVLPDNVNPSFPSQILAPGWNMEDVNSPLKPPIQLKFRQTMAAANGQIGSTDPRSWLGLMRYYYWEQTQVDFQVGLILSALNGLPPAVKNTTIVLFTSDHGDHCGSHSLRTKGASAYDETMRVPLYIKCPQQTVQVTRYQMCCAVDFPRLIAELGNGGVVNWLATAYPYLDRRESIYTFIGGYPEAKRLVALPQLGSIPYILHTYDNWRINSNPGATETWAAQVPRPQSHIVCLRTKTDLNPSSPGYNNGQNGAKLALYYDWADCTWYPVAGQQPFVEYYDYSNLANRQELGNDATSTNTNAQALRDAMRAALGDYSPSGLIGSELLATLPAALQAAQLQARALYLSYISNGAC